MPGVVVSQHSGEGKANQYYVRGFNIDHGTDLATWVAGVPTNMPTHAHGQGYSDNNFLIPELVSGVQYQKGTYDAPGGRLLGGGRHQRQLPERARPAAAQAGGRPGPLRARAPGRAPPAWARPPPLRGRGVPRRRSLGEPGRLPEVERRAALQPGRPAERLQPHRHRATPGAGTPPTRSRDRAVGERTRSTATGPSTRSDAGETHRYTLAGEWRKSTRAGLTVVKAYGDRLRARPLLELHLLPRRSGERRPVRAEGRAHGPRAPP